MANALRRFICGTAASYGRTTNPFLFAGHGLRYRNRKLEIILTTTIDKLGKAGETVKVAPGHFRNHLMPKMLAVPNTPKFAFLIREQRKLFKREEEEVIKEAPKEKEDISLAGYNNHWVAPSRPSVRLKLGATSLVYKESKMREYEMAAKRLNNARLSLRRLIKVDNELREPVTKEELVAEVARQLCVNIHPDNVHLPSPLSSVGEYEVVLRLPRQIPRPEGLLQWTLNVKVRRK